MVSPIYSIHFLEKILLIPDNAMLVTGDVVGLYSNILRSADSNSLKKAFENRVNKHIPAIDSVKMTEFVLSNNYFEFSEKVFQQMSGAAIGAKFTPPCMYSCIYMYEVETDFLEIQ